MDIESIEGWTGTQVVDRDGEKVGKLEDIYFEEGSEKAAFACVKTGLLGRSLSLVPLEGASVSREHLRVAYSKDEIKGAPASEAGAALEPDAEAELARHYGLERPGPSRRYESGGARAQREARAREAAERASELEQLAEAKGDEARESDASADEASRRAKDAEAERRRALDEAAQVRRDADGGSE